MPWEMPVGVAGQASLVACGPVELATHPQPHIVLCVGVGVILRNRPQPLDQTTEPQGKSISLEERLSPGPSRDSGSTECQPGCGGQGPPLAAGGNPNVWATRGLLGISSKVEHMVPI